MFLTLRREALFSPNSWRSAVLLRSLTTEREASGRSVLSVIPQRTIIASRAALRKTARPPIKNGKRCLTRPFLGGMIRGFRKGALANLPCRAAVTSYLAGSVSSRSENRRRGNPAALSHPSGESPLLLLIFLRSAPSISKVVPDGPHSWSRLLGYVLSHCCLGPESHAPSFSRWSLPCGTRVARARMKYLCDGDPEVYFIGRRNRHIFHLRCDLCDGVVCGNLHLAAAATNLHLG